MSAIDAYLDDERRALADPARIEALRARVEAVCPIQNLLRLPQAVTGRFVPVEAPAHPATEIPA